MTIQVVVRHTNNSVVIDSNDGDHAYVSEVLTILETKKLILELRAAVKDLEWKETKERAYELKHIRDTK